MCIIANCNRPRTRYSPLCFNHREYQRRHGHPEQTPLRSAHLNQYRKIVRGKLLGPRGVAVFDAFRPIWQSFLEMCVAPLHRYEAGMAISKAHLEAAAQVQGLRDTGKADDFLITLTALFVLHVREPNFFRSHDAFLVNLQRAVRKEALGSYDLVWNASEQRYARKLRGLSRNGGIALGAWLAQAFAESCGTLAHQIIAEEDGPAERKRRFAESIHDLHSERGSQRTAIRNYPFSKIP